MKWFNNLKTINKLLFGYLLIALFIGVVGYTGWRSMNTIANNATAVYHDNLLPIEQLSKAHSGLLAARGDTYNLLTRSTLEERMPALDSLQNNLAGIHTAMDEFEQSHLVTEEKNLVEEVNADLDKYDELVGALESLVKQDKMDETQILIAGDLNDIRTRLVNNMESLVDLNQAQAEENDAANDTMNQNASGVLFSLTIIALLLAIGLGILIGRLIAQPLVKITAISGALAEGDFTTEVPERLTNRQDEIGMLAAGFNAMILNLQGIATQVNQSSDVVVESADQLAISAQETGKAASEVAASVEEMAKAATAEAEDAGKTADIMKQMTDGLENIGDNAEKVNSLSASFQEIVDNGFKAAASQTESMQITLEKVGSVSSSMNELETKSRQIDEIVKVITSIAEQTNLLALNAAIEAARAGEHGRGFAVVAEEVRKLAEETGAATHNIADIIQAIQNSVQLLVEETNEAQNYVAAQEEAVQTSHGLFEKIGISSREVDAAIQEVSAAIEEMVASSNEVLQAVESISASTQESAASSEEISAIVEEQTASVQTIASLAQGMHLQAEQLKKAMDQIKV
ncbi:MAG: methyl-accepting chemotaxis protein [Syntrophomonadaceae bacterium]|nr:methyl-accepting chemotaxis protein [Syntrophomonadaceae bacterium]MDD3889638.1 methyl-accepting chemotaxis protein [Syntrophomonadaceae bacterium]MDD4549042.1 methyl-accepting chemotaxis protein [Syntrophomonadaceae bacterium]